jgi:hypothetical protein
MKLKPETALVFIALAMRLRDNAHKMTDDEFKELLQEVASYGVMSNRQLAKLTKNRMNHVAISRLIPKTAKTGGKVNGSDLEKMRAIIFSKSIKQTDYRLVLEVLDNGTSQGMLKRITGVSQWSINEKRKEVNGPVLKESKI